MIKKIIILLFFECNLLILCGQTIITGSVKDKNNEPLTASVTIQPKGSKIISSFSITNAQGLFSITYKGKEDSLEITVSGLNVGRHSSIVANKSNNIPFIINDNAFELKEVIVPPPKINQHGDTINYSVGAYTDQSDRVIGDVLKKMPGIKVSDNGTISYNGKNINKFYIENMDLLKGRYGIATENVSAKDVSTVQVLENHQPIKALQDKVPSDNPALNLKLKENAKGTWSVTGLAGIGYQPVLWEGELTGMIFGKKSQNISTYKGNNTGKDIFSEFNSHYDYERVYVGSSSMLSIRNPSSPPVPAKRYLNNRSHAITGNQLIKLSDDLEFTAGILYYNDWNRKEGYSRTQQFMGSDSSLLIKEQVTTVTKTNNAEIALRLTSNAKEYYFDNALNLKGNWNNASGTGNTQSNYQNLNQNISQYLDKSTFSVDNTVNWIKNIKDNSINIYFSSGYGQIPQTLTVSPVDYIGYNNVSTLSQNILSRELASKLMTSYGLRIGDFLLDYNLSEKISLKNLNSDLQRVDSNSITFYTPDSQQNKLWYNNYQTTLNQSYTYKTLKLNAKISFPVTFYILTINDLIQNTFSQYKKWIFTPSYSIRYDLSNFWQLSSSGGFDKSYGSINDAYSGFILQNYRSLVRNSIDKLYESRSGKANLNIRFGNPLSAIFAGAGINYGLFWHNLLYGYDYNDVMSIKTVKEQPTTSDNYGVNIYGQKAFDFWQSNIRINGNYGEGRSELLIQNKIYKYCSQSYNAGTDINIYPLNILSVTYQLSWFQSRSYTEESSTQLTPINGLSQSLKVNIFPTKELTISINTEHQYNSAASNKNILFADAGITYKKKKLDVELEINNIFNTKQYVSASYSDISTYYYSCQLRPISALIKFRFKIK